MADVDAVWAALADPTRREVVDLLRHGPRRAGELATTVGVSGPALSRHLRVLRESGVVAVDFAEDDARGRRYSLREEPFVALQAWLDQVHAFWGEQLAGFADHARRAAETHASAAGRMAADDAATRRDARARPDRKAPARRSRAAGADEMTRRATDQATGGDAGQAPRPDPADKAAKRRRAPTSRSRGGA